VKKRYQYYIRLITFFLNHCIKIFEKSFGIVIYLLYLNGVK